MPWDFFSNFHSQGPTIDPMLIVNAKAQGINMGNAQKTPLQAVLSGVSQGLQLYGQYQNIQANDLNNQIKQNQVDQLPVANRIQQEQLHAQENQNAIQDLKLRQDTANADLTTSAQAAQLEDQTAKSEADAYMQKRISDFQKMLKSSDPQTQAQMVLGGDYNDLFAQSPQAMTQAYKMLLLNPTLTPQQAAQVQTVLRNGAIDEYYAHQAAQSTQKFQQAKENYFNSEPIQRAAQMLQIPKESIADSITFVPAGQFKINPDTGKVQVDSSGSWVQNSALDPTSTINKGKYDIIAKGGEKDGTVIEQGVDKETRQAHYAYLDGRSLVNGQYAHWAKSSIDTSQAKADNIQNPRPRIAPVTSDVSNQKDFLTSTVQSSFSLPDDHVKNLSIPLTTLKNQVIGYVNNPTNRNSPAYLMGMDSTKRSIIKNVIDYQFDNSPAIQSQYTQSDVDTYNKSIDNILNLHAAQSEYTSNVFENPSAMLKVSSPKDLYFRTQYDKYKMTLDDIVRALEKTLQTAQSAPLRKAVSNKAAFNFLDQVQSGASGTPVG